MKDIQLGKGEFVITTGVHDNEPCLYIWPAKEVGQVRAPSRGEYEIGSKDCIMIRFHTVDSVFHFLETLETMGTEYVDHVEALTGRRVPRNNNNTEDED